MKFRVLGWTQKWPATEEHWVEIFSIMVHQLKTLSIDEALDL